MVRYKLYNDFELLLIKTHRWKDLLIDFVTGLLVSTNLKDETYDSILIIINWLIKIVYYMPIIITIDASGLAELILDVVV